MVLILDGISEICAQVRSNLCYSICLRPFIRLRAVTNQILFFLKDLYPLTTLTELPLNTSAMGKPEKCSRAWKCMVDSVRRFIKQNTAENIKLL